MADQPDTLPSKYMSVNPLSASKANRFSCVICSSDSIYVCKNCKTYYCCKSHLDQDNQACHELICERQQQINQVKDLPLAIQQKPEMLYKLQDLQDQCRRICYLQSRRHVLDKNTVLALAAAERSLMYARTVHGSESIELVAPLLALSDVAILAGSKEASEQNVAQAALLLRKYLIIREKEVKSQLRDKIKNNLTCLNEVNNHYAHEFVREEETRQSMSRQSLSRYSMSSQQPETGRSSSNSKQPFRSKSRTKPLAKEAIVQVIEQQTDNQLLDEMFRGEQGQQLALLSSKLHSSRARILFSQKRYENALFESSTSLYFSALCSGVNSLQTALQSYQTAEFGYLSQKYSQNQQRATIVLAQNLLKQMLLKYYSPLITMIEQLIHDMLIKRDYKSEQMQKIVREFNKADFMPEEEKLSFRADMKEAILLCVDSQKILQDSKVDLSECIVLTFIAQHCVEEEPEQNQTDQVKKYMVNLQGDLQYQAELYLLELFVK